MHHRAKLRQSRLNRGRDMAIFQFFKMRPRHLAFLKFLTVGKLNWLKCTIIPNFVKIAQTTAEIWLFFDFQDGGTWYLPHSQVHKSMTALCA